MKCPLATEEGAVCPHLLFPEIYKDMLPEVKQFLRHSICRNTKCRATRELGYYWIRHPEGDWFIGELVEYNGAQHWTFLGNEELFDEPGGEIGPMIEDPQP